MNSQYVAMFNALRDNMERMEVTTENLTNCSTPGYRRTHPVSNSFNDALQKASKPSGSAAVDFSGGSIRDTGNPFDFAITGDGFFAVGKNGKEYYTRNGHFTLNAEGMLVTDSGLQVMRENPTGKEPVMIPPDTNTATLTVDSRGNLKVGDQVIAQLKLALFKDPKALNRVGNTLFEKPAGVEPQKNGEINVQNRALEDSNSVIFEEMANLITCMRNYESCIKIIKAQDAKEGQVIQQVSQ